MENIWIVLLIVWASLFLFRKFYMERWFKKKLERRREELGLDKKEE